MSDRAMQPMASVLVVEDNLEMLEAVVYGLSSRFDVVAASDGSQAIDIINRGTILHALLTDIYLGTLPDGWDVADAFHCLHKGAPVIYASSFSPSHYRHVPGSVFLPKPYCIDKVQDLLTQRLSPGSLQTPHDNGLSATSNHEPG